MPEPLITIVMPALNEEFNIHAAVETTLAAMDKFGVDGEVLVVNDGSTDATGRIVEEMMAGQSRVRMIRHATPQGIGASFWDGVANARGQFVCMMPGDNENDPDETLRYHRLMEHVDILVPFPINKDKRSLFRNILSFTFRTIVNATFVVNFNYTNGTVVYRRCVLGELDHHCPNFFYQCDALIRLVTRGYLFAEVPYALRARAGGKSKAVTFKSLLRVMAGYIKLAKDVYFGRKGRKEVKFVEGSVTALRYNERMKPTQWSTGGPA